MKLKTIGDPMSELNIRRRLRYISESKSPSGILYVNEEWVKEDPALQEAVRRFDWVIVRKHRV